jgi:glycerol uptake facilitator-like aquaporin
VTLSKRAAAEAVGTALLLAVVVGSGIMAERLAGGNGAVALLANALATGAGLSVLILALGPVSGAHFNPVVTLGAVGAGGLPGRDAAVYLAAQFAGALGGVAMAHAMFELPLYSISTHARSGPGQWIAEAVATFGLILTIQLVQRTRPTALPAAVGAYIFAAYWFTASTSFANPAVTLARSFTDTFAGIRPQDVPGFMLAQAAGGAGGVAFTRWLTR